MPEMHRRQTILTIKDKLQARPITCTPTRTGMFTNEIRTAITKTSLTGKANNRVRHKTDNNNLPPVSSRNSNSVPSRARHKEISSNKWKGPIKTGARGHKIITVHNSTSNKTGVDQAVQAVADQEEPGLAVAVAGDGNLKY